ncbi:hypothetical protein [Streptomyces sp. NPDC088725]|uniref:hypothetical protein n=1 Tax=Streptomyces sp. NPDC088725 TaxID=3365873 RepID=UPI003827B21A
MRSTGTLTRDLTRGALAATGSLLAASLLLAGAGSAAAESPSPSPEASDSDAGPTKAGTNFLTATAFRPGQRATAEGSTGDYLYWVVPVDAGQRATVTAKVTFPGPRKGASTWQVDVYDGLRRHQPCAYGTQSRTVAGDALTVEVRCTLRTVRAQAEKSSNDPLPGSYYVRLTVLDAQDADLGLPMHAEAGAEVKDMGGSTAVGGHLAKPLTSDAVAARTAGSPEDGWSSGKWTDRWLWTVGGGVLAAIAALVGYSLARPSRRSAGAPPRA